MHSGVRGKQSITHEQDHHAQEHHGHLYLRRPPQVRTTSDSNCFHRLDRCGRKSYCNRLGSKTTKLWVFRPILLEWENFSHSAAFVPSTRWHQAAAVELKRRHILGQQTALKWASTPKRKVSRDSQGYCYVYCLDIRVPFRECSTKRQRATTQPPSQAKIK